MTKKRKSLKKSTKPINLVDVAESAPLLFLVPTDTDAAIEYAQLSD
jgi:hypothetical protein